MTKPVSDASALVLPFGKHKGRTVAELLTHDPAYAEWIVNQGWVAERFAELHAAILSRGAASDDSPEHNAIQVRFLDPVFQAATLIAAIPSGIEGERMDGFRSYKDRIIEKLNPLKSQLDQARRSAAFWNGDKAEVNFWGRYSEAETPKLLAELPPQIEPLETALAQAKAENGKIISCVRFEHRGVDVMIQWGVSFYPDNPHYPNILPIEIKPTMGDDFPSVMRQMERLGCKVVVVGEYTGRAVSEPQLRQMFEANRRVLLFVRDIESEIANVRGVVA